MRFVPSWDDSVLAPVAAVVAGATALFSGHAIFRSDPPTVVPISAPPVRTTDTGASPTEPGSAPPPRLCDQVLTKEADVDALNDQIDVLLRDVKAREDQRRK